MPQLGAEHGTYALILVAEGQQSVAIGRLGTLDVQPGFYVYVGSARGSGGLAARIARHARAQKQLHWHIDYLRAVTQLKEVWYAESDEKQECRWAEGFARMKGATMPMTGFGASDCTCESHLFHFPTRPGISAFRRRLASLAGEPASVQRTGAADI
jgi:Uri superfamily endonuclease